MKEVTPTQMEIFERAFSSKFSGCRRQCACGKEFYHDCAGAWDWNEGELEALRADPSATALDYTPGGVMIYGVEHCNACTCWLEKAQRIITWLEGNVPHITEYLRLKKEALEAEAETFAKLAP
jgi:hypothetical protein